MSETKPGEHRPDMRDAWPIGDVFQRLLDAADHLHHVHNCDRHGYEEVRAAVDAGRQHLEPIGARLVVLQTGERVVDAKTWDALMVLVRDAEARMG